MTDDARAGRAGQPRTVNLGTPDELTGLAVLGSDGKQIGKVDEVWLDDATDAPEWVTVSTGVFGSGKSLIPLAAASRDADGLHVPYDKALVKDAPVDPPHGDLSPDDERQLYEHYRLGYAPQGAAGGTGGGWTAGSGQVTSGAGLSDATGTVDSATTSGDSPLGRDVGAVARTRAADVGAASGPVADPGTGPSEAEPPTPGVQPVDQPPVNQPRANEDGPNQGESATAHPAAGESGGPILAEAAAAPARGHARRWQPTAPGAKRIEAADEAEQPRSADADATAQGGDGSSGGAPREGTAQSAERAAPSALTVFEQRDDVTPAHAATAVPPRDERQEKESARGGD